MFDIKVVLQFHALPNLLAISYKEKKNFFVVFFLPLQEKISAKVFLKKKLP